MSLQLPDVLWIADQERASRSAMAKFIERLTREKIFPGGGFHQFYQWSVDYPSAFWREVWKECGIIASVPATSVVELSEKMPGARWFPGARLNFAENLLRASESCSIVFYGEDAVRRELPGKVLRRKVGALAAYLRELGIKPGDRVAGMMPNIPEAVIAMLAATSIGAVWSSASPDFGVSGIVDRFGQSQPKVLFACDHYLYKHTRFPLLEKISQVTAAIPSIEKAIVASYTGEPLERSALAQAAPFDDCTAAETEPTFEQLPFDHPLYLMFSSGTTGAPKCIVHSAGGTLIEHLKELVLHTDLSADDTFFYQTTCGWMMWNWLMSGLATGARLVLYDGAPLLAEGDILWKIAEREAITIFGTNAKYLSAIDKAGLKPAERFDLSPLRTILSTGSPLAPESFDYVYREIKRDVMLSSISGGTDIIGCFALGCPLLPVYRGELQTRSLGLAVEVFNDNGESVLGEKGELVCLAPFPSAPVGFLNDPDDERYHRAYFARFPGVWHHGDYCELTPWGGVIIYGRSDAVLNPGGIRIGTAEIYRQVETLPEIEESLVVAQEWRGDVRTVLFVRLKDGIALDDPLRTKIRATIRLNTTPHHVPGKIIAVPDIPRTRSGKITELAVRDLIHHRPVKNAEALANPEAMEFFKDIPELLTE